MELSQRIQQLRKEQNMTQQDLADRLFVSRQAVSRWEMGTAMPDLENLVAMSRVFGVTVDELLTGEKAAVPETAEPKKPDPRKWVRAWLLTCLAIAAVFAVWTFVQWKFGGLLIAMTPMTVAVQLINICFDVGLIFAAIYFIRRLGRK